MAIKRPLRLLLVLILIAAAGVVGGVVALRMVLEPQLPDVGGHCKVTWREGAGEDNAPKTERGPMLWRARTGFCSSRLMLHPRAACAQTTQREAASIGTAFFTLVPSSCPRPSVTHAPPKAVMLLSVGVGCRSSWPRCCSSRCRRRWASSRSSCACLWSRSCCFWRECR